MWVVGHRSWAVGPGGVGDWTGCGGRGGKSDIGVGPLITPTQKANRAGR